MSACVVLFVLFVSAQATRVRADEELPPFKLGLSTQVVAAGFDLTPQPPGPSSSKLTYRPAQSNYVGLILGYRWISGTISFAVPANPDIRAVEGVSQYRDYRLSYYNHWFGVEASYTRYKGYLIDNSSSLNPATLNGQQYYSIPDLETLGYGVTLFYVPSSGDFSLPAALDQSVVQSKSGGAWLLLASWRQQAITSWNPWIPAEKLADFGADAQINLAHTLNLGAGGGYAYNLVWKHLFIAPMAALALAYQNSDVVVQGTESIHVSAELNAHIRLATGYNAPGGFIVADVYMDRFDQDTSTIKVGTNIYGVTLAGGLRF